MMPLSKHAACVAAYTLLSLLLTACGGGAGEQTAASSTVEAATPLAADAAPAGIKRIQAITLNADAAATTLLVRAHGVLAAGVGPVIRVLVDGVEVGTTEVRATEPTDFSFAVPALQPGAKVDVVYTNDATIGGVDRNLFITQLRAGATAVLPNSPGAVIDRGVGAAAFDGVDTVPGQVGFYWNAALRLTWPEPNLTDSLTVRASASLAGNVGPIMALRVDGVIVGSTEVRSAEPADHVFAVPPLKPGSKVDVVYTNAESVDGVPRKLNLAYLLSSNTVLLPTATGVVIDLGTGAAAFDNLNVLAGQGLMTASGALRAKWPVPNITDSLTVRASGTLAGNVGPTMQVRVDGVLLKTTEVRTTTPTDYTVAVTPLKPGSQVDIAFTNAGSVGGQTRSLRVPYLIAGSTFLKPTMPGVVFDLGSGEAAVDGLNLQPGRTTLDTNGALRASWPARNLTDSLIVRARGTLAGNVGPVMQLHVDGVIVGSAEVRSLELSDYTFTTPPLQPGSKLDVVFTNDAVIDNAHRDLYLAYLIAGNTYILPTAADAVYDRGVGAAAFDGLDTLSGRYSMGWGGAMRMTWTAPNLTSTVTVRASGTLAGNVGPVIALRVDGVIVGTTEVRSADPADYIFAVPPLKAGAKVEVIHTNQDTVNSVERKLNLAYLMAGSTVLLPTAPGAVLDQGTLRAQWPAPNLTDSITVRAKGRLAGNVGPTMQVRVDGVVVGSTEVRATDYTDYSFATPTIRAGSKVDVVFTNDATISGQDRDLYVAYLSTANTYVLSTATGVTYDRGAGAAAFDGLDLIAGRESIAWNGALRFTVPANSVDEAKLQAQYAASRFLQQATFGPTMAEINRIATTVPAASWLAEQMAMPATPAFTSYVQSKYDLGESYRPKGANYTSAWVGQKFWANAAGSPDQLRKRVAFALHQIFMVSQNDTNLYEHGRAYAAYLDKLNQHAFGNFRALLEDMALSPAMGIYLSHMRNRKEDPVTGRQPDENFAREVMQLFTIGLHELNQDGSLKRDAGGRPIETYTNNDVMAMAKVFTGWSWAFPDADLTEQNFRWGNPDLRAAYDQRIDQQRMKPYPGQHSNAEKRLFQGKASAVVIPANSSAQDSLRMALDTLFNHPNVAPFIGRQLIQRLVTSDPSAAYVSRVAASFNNNGAGVRGDLAAVVRAVLLDPEAVSPPTGSVGKLREPVLRVAHWMRSFGAVSATGETMMALELQSQSQRVLNAPSVFGYFRPGYVPPNTALSASGTTVPEMQLVNESTAALWVNQAMAMTSVGVGWTGTGRDVSSALTDLVALSAAGNTDGMIERINLLLFAGRMGSALRQDILNSVASVAGSTAASHLYRARVALFLALASPDYLVQR